MDLSRSEWYFDLISDDLLCVDRQSIAFVWTSILARSSFILASCHLAIKRPIKAGVRIKIAGSVFLFASPVQSSSITAFDKVGVALITISVSP